MSKYNTFSSEKSDTKIKLFNKQRGITYFIVCVGMRGEVVNFKGIIEAEEIGGTFYIFPFVPNFHDVLTTC